MRSDGDKAAKMKTSLYQCVHVGLLICLCTCSSAIAQQDSATQNPVSDPQQKPTAPDSGVGQTPNQGDETPVSSAPVDQIRVVNGGSPLPSGHISPLQFGPIAVASADFFESIQGVAVSGVPGRTWESDAIFRTNLVFDKEWQTGRFSVQYQPRLSIIQGTAQTDTSNLISSLTKQFQLTPRLSVHFDNTLEYYSQQGQFNNLSILGDLTSGTLTQSQFLDGSGHFLNERVGLEFRYLLSPRSRFDVTPFFNYYLATGMSAIGQGKSPGVSLDYGYALSANRTVGLSYSWNKTYYSETLPSSTYQTVNANYSQQLSATLRLSLAAGFTQQSATMNSSDVAATGSFSLIKSFGQSSLAVQYYRGQAVGLQITNGFADRVDASYDRRISLRLRTNVGLGYYREFSSATNTSGLYGTGELGYLLTDHWSLETVYAYKRQENGGTTFRSGNLQYVSFGLRWEAGRSKSSKN
jgi:hypothetical protein